MKCLKQLKSGCCRKDTFSCLPNQQNTSKCILAIKNMTWQIVAVDAAAHGITVPTYFTYCDHWDCDPIITNGVGRVMAVMYHM